MIIDHIGLSVETYEESKDFYKKALLPLGLELVLEIEHINAAGFGKGNKPEFWLSKGKRTEPCVHVAFVAENKEQVDAFYNAAIGAGGTDNGKPGVREIYHPNYYGAFVLDPDGNNIEAVFHG